jgi:hypothetical protein
VPNWAFVVYKKNVGAERGYKYILPLSSPGITISTDPTAIPPHIREQLTRPDGTAQALEAMKLFVNKRDEAAFERAVALYVASARERDEPIETVLAVLCELASGLEGPRVVEELLLHPTKMHRLIFAGILRAFYGSVAVEREIGASAQRKADATQHVEKGTWPKRAAD